MRKLALTIAATVLSLLLGACSSSGGSHPTSSSSSSAATSGSTITISGFAFSGDLTVKAGATVTVVNKDTVPHTLTDKANGKFDTGTIAPGGTGTFTAPSQAGTYSFGCRIHPDMHGTLTVQ